MKISDKKQNFLLGLALGVISVVLIAIIEIMQLPSWIANQAISNAAADHVPNVLEVTEVRVRWLGHRMLADVNIAVKRALSVEEGHEIAREVRHQLLHHLPYLANATIHVDPANASGEHHHGISEHDHDELPTHSH